MFSTSQGSRLEPFGWVEWALLCGVALIWGSSFLLIEIGLESLEPATITWVRVALGFLVLTVFPAARKPVERADYPHVVLLAFIWVVVPFLLFPIAQQHIDSALAAMLNASVPIHSAAVAVMWLRSLPRLRQAAGIALGLAGTVRGLAQPAAASSSSTKIQPGTNHHPPGAHSNQASGETDDLDAPRGHGRSPRSTTGNPHDLMR